jgi:hypothetical protein
VRHNSNPSTAKFFSTAGKDFAVHFQGSITLHYYQDFKPAKIYLITMQLKYSTSVMKIIEYQALK